MQHHMLFCPQVTIPGAKEAFRIVGTEGIPLLDVMVRAGEERPQVGVYVIFASYSSSQASFKPLTRALASAIHTTSPGRSHRG